MDLVALAALCIAAWVFSGYMWRLVERLSPSQRRRAGTAARTSAHGDFLMKIKWWMLLMAGLALTVVGLLRGETIADRGSFFMFGLITLALAAMAFDVQRTNR
jgi:hypothetical protein